MENASSILSELDCLCGFASLAVNAPKPYVKPKINTGGKLVLRESRHPCLEVIDAANTIANDCEMEN